MEKVLFDNIGLIRKNQHRLIPKIPQIRKRTTMLNLSPGGLHSDVPLQVLQRRLHRVPTPY